MIKFSLLDNNSSFLFVVRITLIVSSLIGAIEVDIKKIVALRTIRQISFIALSFSLGFHTLAYLHLIVHAIFKRLIFICIGNLIHISSDNQHQLLIGGKRRRFTVVVLQISIFALIGIGFTSGFIRKDAILDSLEQTNNLLFIVVLLFNVGLTFLYSFRLLTQLRISSKGRQFLVLGGKHLKGKENTSLSFLLLFILCLVLGKIVRRNFLLGIDFFSSKTIPLFFVFLSSSLLYFFSPFFSFIFHFLRSRISKVMIILFPKNIEDTALEVLFLN